MDNLFVYLAVAAATCGLLSHIFYFIHGERHTNAIAIVKTYILLPPASVAALYYGLHLDIAFAFRLVATVVGAFTCSLWTSILVYRIFFHRLNKFPGPRLARLSKFYHASQLLGFDNYRVLARWHDRYGDIVRIGELVLFLSTLYFSISLHGHSDVPSVAVLPRMISRYGIPVARPLCPTAK